MVCITIHVGEILLLLCLADLRLAWFEEKLKMTLFFFEDLVSGIHGIFMRIYGKKQGALNLLEH